MSTRNYADFVVITTNAGTLRVITDEQRMTISRFAEAYSEQRNASRLIVHKGGFDLPEGYVTCAIYEDEDLIMYYGIAPDGQASS